MPSQADTLTPSKSRMAGARDWPSRTAPTLPLLGYGAIFTIVLVLLRPGGYTLPSFSSCGQVMAGLAGLVACVVALSRSQSWDARTRWAWIAFAGGLLCHTVGRVLIAYIDQVYGAVTFPSVGDYFMIAKRPFIWVGLLLLARPGRSTNLSRLILDALIVVLAVLVMSWTMVLSPLLMNSEGSSQRTLFFFVIYPLADIGVLFCLLLMIATTRARPGFSQTVEFLVLGVLSLVVTRAVYLYQVLTDSYTTGSLVDIGWVWGCLLVGAAALTQNQVKGEAIETAGHEAPAAPLTGASDFRLVRWRQATMLWLPSIAAILVAAGFFLWQLRNHNDVEAQRWMPLIVLMVAFVVRQMLTLSDNLQLTERLKLANEDLEQNVNERTRHLSTLHAITSALNTSLDQQTVLRATLEETMEAVGADSGAVWLSASDHSPGDVMLLDGAAPVPRWTLVHSSGFEEDEAKLEALMDLAVTVAEERRVAQAQLARVMGNDADDDMTASSLNQNYLVVPIRWQGVLFGAMGLLRKNGFFKWEDSALMESVALEAGAALQNARLYHEAKRRADRDGVTDLFNHRAIQQHLNTCLMQARISDTEFGLVIMDLNNFKFFNDTYGHIVGDEVLRTVSECLREACRTTDVLGRFGGDEFIALLPDTDSAGTMEVCARIASLLDNRHFQAAPDLRVPITMAFGWAIFPHDGDSALDLITRADTELYEHKRGGGRDYSAVRRDDDNREETRRLKTNSWGGSFGVLDALVTAIDNKDHYTRHHSEEVTRLSLLIAKDMGYSEQGLRAVRISGLLHDVGKIAVPDAILRHPGRLGPEEARIMRQHPVLGALIVKDLPHLDQVLDGIRHHHERWDGRGYPDGLSATAIPAMGRLLAVADCYSAMTTDRPYRKAFTPQDALGEIERLSGSQFDPVIAAAFVKLMRQELINPSEKIESEITSLAALESVLESALD